MHHLHSTAALTLSLRSLHSIWKAECRESWATDTNLSRLTFGFNGSNCFQLEMFFFPTTAASGIRKGERFYFGGFRARPFCTKIEPESACFEKAELFYGPITVMFVFQRRKLHSGSPAFILSSLRADCNSGFFKELIWQDKRLLCCPAAHWDLFQDDIFKDMTNTRPG